MPASGTANHAVGHNPGLEELLVYLAGQTPPTEDGKLLPTAALARLRMPDSWHSLARGCAELVDLVRPALDGPVQAGECQRSSTLVEVDARPAQLDDRTRDSLRALGYIDGDPPVRPRADEGVQD